MEEINIEKIFNKNMSIKYNIHRTRQNFKNNGLDDFKNMSIKGVQIIDNVVKKQEGRLILKMENGMCQNNNKL